MAHGASSINDKWIRVLAIQTLAVLRWKISRICKISDSSKIAFHVLTAAPGLFFPGSLKIKVFCFKSHHDPVRRFSSDSFSLASQHEMTDKLRPTSSLVSFNSPPGLREDQPMPLPTNTDRNGVQGIVYFLTIISSEEINPLVFRRNCQVNLSLQLLLNKSKALVLN